MQPSVHPSCLQAFPHPPSNDDAFDAGKILDIRRMMDNLDVLQSCSSRSIATRNGEPGSASPVVMFLIVVSHLVYGGGLELARDPVFAGA